MKMNTYVFAPAAGTVKEILVTPGDAVAEGQVLVKLS
jgi:biotin carboxyl carrier protein